MAKSVTFRSFASLIGIVMAGSLLWAQQPSIIGNRPPTPVALSQPTSTASTATAKKPTIAITGALVHKEMIEQAAASWSGKGHSIELEYLRREPQSAAINAFLKAANLVLIG